jgi:hypothetical protein
LLSATTCSLAACSSSPAPPVPEMPSYAADVLPIFSAHCVMCHGAGGMLNAAPNPDGSPNTVGAPLVCYLSMYDDAGDCTALDAGGTPASCKRGAHYCTTPPNSFIETYAVTLSQDEGGMPPPPWPPLSARDREVIMRWLQDPIP